MKKTLRYGEYLGAVRARQRTLDYNKVVAADLEPARRRQQLRMKDIYRVLTPYVSVRFLEQFKSVVPLALFLALFAAVVLNSAIAGAHSVALGIVSVIVGLMLFLEGTQHGLMPFSENIGFNLPSRSTWPVILGVAFLLGAATTLAEPEISILRSAGSLTDPERAPALYSLLNHHGGALVAAVALSVGVAVMVGILRMVMNWRLKHLIIITLPPCLALTAYVASQPQLAPIVGLAWDCGAITTGPVTVPIVLALGIGVTAAAGREDNPLSGFGIVTLASMFPSFAVMLLALIMPLDDVQAIAAMASTPWYEESPAADVVAAVRAIVPLTVLLWLVQRVLLKDPIANRATIAYGIVLCIVGMLFFNLGLTYGLSELGNASGNILPAAFAQLGEVKGSPLYPYWIGLAIVIGFAAALGYGATAAEPALNAMGITVQNLTDGAFPRKALIRASAIGVAAGTAAGVIRVIFDIPIAYLLLPAYAIALIMTVLADEIYVNLAWDAAGVTTGSVTVPLVLAMGLGIGQTMHAVEGFGILALASVAPIISVLGVGLWIRLTIASSHARASAEEAKA
ncbi:MAG: hypothetical protein JWN94_1662 [Betaproteobacteria bacterium]|nr:hypothetical protein [Betaproteobacteria bacterium]